MQDLVEASVHQKVVRLANEIRGLKIYEGLHKKIQKVTCSPSVKKRNLSYTLNDAIQMVGLEIEIRNIIYQLIKNQKMDMQQTAQLSNPLRFLKKVGLLWERRVHKSLNAMCIELGIPTTGQCRGSAEREEMIAKWDELSSYSEDLSNYRPVYAPKDLLDVLISMKGPHRIDDTEKSRSKSMPNWEFAHIPIPVKNFFELREHYGDLLRSQVYDNSTYERVLAKRHAPLCQQALRKGNTPPQYRGTLYSFVLGSHVSTYHIQCWESLKSSVFRTESIIDKLIFKDVQLTASNDDQYFVFEDVLYQIFLCFSRDSEIVQIITYLDDASSKKGNQVGDAFSSIIPFHGICMFAAPFCYLYDEPVGLYFTFRSFYIRYCHRLTTISSHPQGLVSLCLLFEKLLQSHEPQLWSHFRELQIQPIRLVFKWLMRAFSGHLPPDQLLSLWDLVLGFDSLEILSLLAIIILSLRKENLLQVHNLENIESVLADLSSIKVLPVIQLAFSRD